MDQTQTEDPDAHYFSKRIADEYEAVWENANAKLIVPRSVVDNRYTRFYELLPANALVLDAGCGTGRLTKRLIARGFNVIGMDYSEQMLEKARASVPGVKFLKMDIRELEFNDGTFDGVINFGVLPHIMEERACNSALRN